MKKFYSKKFYSYKNIGKLVLVILLTITASYNSYSQVRVNFEPRTSVNSPNKTIYNVKGDFTMIGNTNLTLEDYGNNTNNSNNDMEFVDTDGDSNTDNSSSATLTFSTENGADPNCSNIIYAGLYWSGRGNSNLTDIQKRTIKFKGPNQSYQTIIAEANEIKYPGDNRMYAAYAEVTDLVQSGGLGEYWIADMAISEGDGGGTGYYGGWGMVVIYENSKMKWKDITVFDGYAFVCGSCTEDYEFPVSGFNAVQSGDVNVKIGMMAGEGDRGISGDYFEIRNAANSSWIDLDHSGNSTDNFFNSSIVTGGNARNPNLLNNTGIDISMFDLDNSSKNIITNNQTSTKFRYGTTQDTYIIFNVTFAVDAYVPEAQALIVVDNPPGPVTAGQDIQYTVKIYNKGNEEINNTVISIPIPFTTHTPNIVSYTNNINSTSPSIVGNDFIWNIGTLPVPNNPDDILASFTFKLTATDNCALLANSCGGKIYLDGFISGEGDNSDIDFNQNLIQEVVSGSCDGEVISTPLITEISHECGSSNDDIVLYFCDVTSVLVSDVADNFPSNSRFYNEYPLSNNSTEYTTTFPGAGTYYAYPPGSTNCYFEFIISIGNSPNAVAGDDKVLTCSNNKSVTLEGSSTTSEATFSWSGPDNFSSTSQTPIVTVVGVYTLTVTDPNSGCSATDEVTTTLDDTLPTVAIVNSNGLALSCTVPNTILTASGGVSYSWSDGTNIVSTEATLEVTTAGTFTVTVTAANGCSDTAEVTTTLDDTLPTVAIANSNGLALSCTVPNTILTASGGVSYSWSDGTNIVSTEASLEVTTAGTFTVTVTAANGCSATDEVTTTLDDTLPTVAIVNSNGLALSCTVPNTILTASGGVSYSWSDGTNIVSTEATLEVTTAGTFTVTVTGSNGCSATDEVTTTLDDTLPTVAIANSNGLALSCTVPNTILTLVQRLLWK